MVKAQARSGSKISGKGPSKATTKTPKPPKIKPPIVAVRAGTEGERVVTVSWPDGARMELSARTDGEWRLLTGYPDRSLVLDRVELLPEEL